MTAVFIGGSRGISRLTKEVTARIDNIARENFAVLIGDAYGADRAVQKYLLELDYKKVTVFCVAGDCRNNLGVWETHQVEVTRNGRDFHYFAAKDLQMARQADYGFMLWNASSVGTLQNILNLLKLGKLSLVYLSSEKQFWTISTVTDLTKLISTCDKIDVDRFEQKLNLSKVLLDLLNASDKHFQIRLPS